VDLIRFVLWLPARLLALVLTILKAIAEELLPSDSRLLARLKRVIDWLWHGRSWDSAVRERAEQYCNAIEEGMFPDELAESLRDWGRAWLYDDRDVWAAISLEIDRRAATEQRLRPLRDPEIVELWNSKWEDLKKDHSEADAQREVYRWGTNERLVWRVECIHAEAFRAQDHMVTEVVRRYQRGRF
jgi:hypothetical protein